MCSETICRGVTPARRAQHVLAANGRLTKVLSTAATWQILGYDALGRPTSSSETVGTQTYTFPNYGFNLADRLTSITYPSGRVITTGYDLAGRRSAVSSGATAYATLTTNPGQGVFADAPQGAIQQMTLGMSPLLRPGPLRSSNLAHPRG